MQAEEETLPDQWQMSVSRGCLQHPASSKPCDPGGGLLWRAPAAQQLSQGRIVYIGACREVSA